MHTLDKLDPDWIFAQNHGLANRAGLPPLHNDTQQPIQLCPCCHEYINKQPLSLWQNSKQLEFLGFGFPLFYQFLKLCIILLALAICSYNAMGLQQAIQSNYSFCHKSTDNTDNTTHRLLAGSTTQTTTKIKVCYTFLIQLSRIQDTVTNQQEAIRIVSFVLQMLALLYIRNRIIKLQAYYDERTTSLSDYSVAIKGLPKIIGIQKLMRQFFKKQFKTQHQIQQITLLPQYDQIQKLIQQKNKIITQLRKHYQKQPPHNVSEQSNQLQIDLKNIQRNLSSAAMDTKLLAQKDQLLCQKMICVFNTQQQKQQILQQFEQISQQKKKQYFGQQYKKSIKIKQAPQPQQIIWQNANIPKKKRFFYIILGWSLSIIVLVIAFIVIYFVLQAKSLHLEQAIAQLHSHPDQQKYKIKYRGALTIVYILMFLIVIFDKIVLATLFHKFSILQKPTTASRLQFSFALKLCLGLFATTALMTLAVQAIRFGNYYSHPYGVIDEETIMFFMNSFFVPFFWLVNPMRIARQIKRKLNYGKKSLTQLQANRLMQQDHYDMGKRFAQIIQMMWFTFLYSTLIPIGAVLTCAGLIFYYWVDKYNLLRRSSVSGQVSGQIINLSLNLLDFTLILRPAGTLIFDTQIRHQYKHSTIIMVICAFIYIILPKDKLIEIFNDQKFRLQTKTYKEMKNVFHKTYHTEHPVYRFIHKQKFTQRMIKKGLSFGAGSIDKSSLQLIQQSNDITKKLKSSTEIDLGFTQGASP